MSGWQSEDRTVFMQCRVYREPQTSMASTILNEHGWDPELVEVALAHVDSDEVRSAYNRAD